MSRIILGFNKNAFSNQERRKEFVELLTKLEEWISIANHPANALQIEVGEKELEGMKKSFASFTTLQRLIVSPKPSEQ